MKKTAFVVALGAFTALVIAGCGATDKTCATSEECPAGEVCGVDLVCVERVCNGKGDCTTGEICVAGELVGKDAGWKFCSAPLCDNVTKLCQTPQTCQDGICVDDSNPTDVVEDVIDTDTPREDTTVEQDVPAELPPITEINDCKSCVIAGDCGTGYTCQPVGSEKHCLRDCNNDGNCLPGYTCYTQGTSKACLPVQFNCVACTFDTPCDEGKCCDFSSGACKDCQQECFPCLYDYDCAAGLRCYKPTAGEANGVCVPECVDGACADSANYACNDNGKGVEICVPTTAGCKGCSGDTPWPLDGVGCVECRNTDDCGVDEMCKTDTHTCQISTCGSGTIMCEDNQCKQCCKDDDCLRFEDATGVCNPDGTCEGVVPCDGLCTDAFPVCAVVGGVEQCVQCLVDEDCAMIGPNCTCVGDPLYSCMDSTGAICQPVPGSCSAECDDASDCPPTSTGGEMGCATVSGLPKGLCYDPAGTCDGASACCSPGQSCYDLMLLIMGVMGGGMMPGMEGMTSGSGYCGCETAEDCLNGKECMDLSMICALGSLLGQFAAMIELICPGGQLSPNMPQHLCMSLTDLFGGII